MVIFFLVYIVDEMNIIIINSSTYDSDIPNADVLLIKNGSITIEENKFIDRTTSKRSLFRKVKF